MYAVVVVVVVVVVVYDILLGWSRFCWRRWSLLAKVVGVAAPVIGEETNSEFYAMNQLKFGSFFWWPFKVDDSDNGFQQLSLSGNSSSPSSLYFYLLSAEVGE